MPFLHELRERIPRDCRLPAADVAFLLAHHRPHVRLWPTGIDGLTRVVPTGYVGTISTPTCCLRIRPKIPIDNLFYLLDPDILPPHTQAPCAATLDADLLDFLANRLARLMVERTRSGLHRDYAERAEQGPFLHGQLDVARQLREAAGRPDQLHCRFDDWTVNVPCNQLPRSVAEVILRVPLLSEPVRRTLGQALAGFDGVQTVPLSARSVAAAKPRQTTLSYLPLWELCRLLAESLAGSNGIGQATCPAFLVNMESVFEQYVARELCARLKNTSAESGLSVSVQPWIHAARGQAGGPDLGMRPDLIVLRDGEPCMVLDTKWKRLATTHLFTSDVYQLLAYCTTLGIHRASLIYPGRRPLAWTYTLERSPVEFTVQTVRVVGSRDQCSGSMDQLADAVRRTCAR